MRRCLSILIVLSLCITLAGCGRMQAGDDNDTADRKAGKTLKEDHKAPAEEEPDNKGKAAPAITPVPSDIWTGEPLQPSDESVDYEYVEIGDGVEIMRYTGVSSAVVIPDRINGTPVRWIGPDAFRDRRDLIGIIIPATVLELDPATFTGCTSLETITVDPDSRSYASEGGILFDEQMIRLICYPAGRTDSSYIIPDGVTEIGYSAFSKNPYIKSVIIPDSVRWIEAEAFAGCTALENLIIPEDLKYIDDSAFSGCPSLKLPAYPRADSGDGYILPMSSQRLLTYADIEGLSKEEIAYARNEIYARHGYVFQKQKYRDYFGSKSWYKPNPDFKESDLSETEKENVDFLLQYEGQ